MNEINLSSTSAYFQDGKVPAWQCLVVSIYYK